MRFIFISLILIKNIHKWPGRFMTDNSNSRINIFLTHLLNHLLKVWTIAGGCALLVCVYALKATHRAFHQVWPKFSESTNRSHCVQLRSPKASLHEVQRSLFVKQDDLTSHWGIVCIWQHLQPPAPQMWKHSSSSCMPLFEAFFSSLLLIHFLLLCASHPWSHSYASRISKAYLRSVLMSAACPDSMTDSTSHPSFSLPLPVLHPDNPTVLAARLLPAQSHGLLARR